MKIGSGVVHAGFCWVSGRASGWFRVRFRWFRVGSGMVGFFRDTKLIPSKLYVYVCICMCIYVCRYIYIYM